MNKGHLINPRALLALATIGFGLELTWFPSSSRFVISTPRYDSNEWDGFSCIVKLSVVSTCGLVLPQGSAAVLLLPSFFLSFELNCDSIWHLVLPWTSVSYYDITTMTWIFVFCWILLILWNTSMPSPVSRDRHQGDNIHKQPTAPTVWAYFKIDHACPQDCIQRPETIGYLLCNTNLQRHHWQSKPDE